jgi:hypothetical protein
MDLSLRDAFLARWQKYFAGAELPITFEYTNADRGAALAQATAENRCLIAALNAVRAGQSLRFATKSFGCAGGRFYTGFADRIRTNIAEFLSCGIEGTMEGERYKQTPELAAAALTQVPHYTAPADHLLFKRWDKLVAGDEPQAVIFFATPDVLAGLFTLANYDSLRLYGPVIAPFGSGCAAIVQYPYAEAKNAEPRAVLGMFDVSARPHVPAGTLTFAVPFERFTRMVQNMDESFLITPSWDLVRQRIGDSRDL